MSPNSAKEAMAANWSQELICLATTTILCGTNVRLIFYDRCDSDFDGGTDVVNSTWSSVTQPKVENREADADEYDQ
jgi:hypothetical protein